MQWRQAPIQKRRDVVPRGPCTIAHFLCTLHDMILCTLIFCNFTSHFALMHPRRNGLTGGACPAMGAPLIALILIGHLYIAPRSTHHSTHDDGAPPEGATGLRSPCRLSCRQLAGCSPGEYQNSIVMVVQRTWVSLPHSPLPLAARGAASALHSLRESPSNSAASFGRHIPAAPLSPPQTCGLVLVQAGSLSHLLKQATALEDWLVGIRRTLHKIPELLFEEHATGEVIRRHLDELGIPYQFPVAKTGVVASIGQGAPVVVLRSDIDALPIQEEDEKLEFASNNPGRMHACGHDAHMTM